MRAKIITINAQSIRFHDKRIMLQNILNDYAPLAVLLCETWLNKNQQLMFSGYSTFREDRDGRGGGVAVVIRRSAECRILQRPAIHSFESVAVQVFHQDGTSTILASVYKAPNKSFESNDWTNWLNNLPAAENLIIGGDLNCRHQAWKCSINTRDGVALLGWAAEMELTIAASKHPSRGTEHLDLFLHGGRAELAAGRLELDTIPFPSDHDAVVAQYRLSASVATVADKLVFDWKNSDLTAFATRLDEIVVEIPISTTNTMSVEEIRGGIHCLNVAFGVAMDEKIIARRNAPRYEPDVTTRTMHLINVLRQWRSEVHYFNKRNADGRHIGVISNLKSQISCLSKIVRDGVKIDRQAAFAAKCKKIRAGPNMFGELKRLSNYKRFTQIPDRILVDGSITTDKVNQANFFGKSFEEVHIEAASRLDDARSANLEAEMGNIYDNFDPAIEFSDEMPAFPDDSPHNAEILVSGAEVSEIIQKLNGKTSRGIDMVPNRLLRATGPGFRRIFTILLNQISNRGLTPEIWKMALVTPALKPGKDPSLPGSYRPISLLCNLAKVWERVMLRRLEEWMAEEEIIPENQFGFSRGMSTTDALAAFSSRVATNINDCQPTAVVSLDLKKAFDSISPMLIIKKLTEKGFSRHWTRCLFSFLKGRRFAVNVNGAFSRVFEAVSGVPQGSVLGPALFKFVVADITQPIERNMAISQFADDMLVMAWGIMRDVKRRLERYLRNLMSYYEENGIACNHEKTQFMIATGTLCRYTRRIRQQIKDVNIRLNGQPLNKSTTLKFLGITFDDKFTFTRHMAKSLLKIRTITGAMNGLLQRKGLLTSHVKAVFYKTAIRPVLTYGFPSWIGISSHQMELMRMAERKFIRWARVDGGRESGTKYINSRRIYVEAGIERIDSWALHSYMRTFGRMSHSQNSILAALFDPDAVTRAQVVNKYTQPEAPYHRNGNMPIFEANGRTYLFNRRIRDGGRIYVTEQ